MKLHPTEWKFEASASTEKTRESSLNEINEIERDKNEGTNHST
jgi:hypothetical protein